MINILNCVSLIKLQNLFPSSKGGGNNNNNNNVVGYNMSARAPGANSDISPPALDFDDLPASQTVKWFAENPDLNPSKVNAILSPNFSKRLLASKPHSHSLTFIQKINQDN